MNTKNLILVGGGGHCKSVIDVVESAGYHIIGILDKPSEVGKKVLAYEIVGTDDDMDKYVNEALFMVTVGQIKSPALRIKLHDQVKKVGGKLATIIASTAYVSKYATIGEGSIVMHNAFVNAGAKIGKGCIINTYANIEHDVEVGDYCHISTGAMINGDCKIDTNVFIGSQCVIAQGVNITNNAIISAGTFIKRDIKKDE